MGEHDIPHDRVITVAPLPCFCVADLAAHLTEALNALKKKKAYEQQFNQLDGQILNLDQTIFALEK